MPFPLISEYIEAIKSSENFKQLRYLHAIWNNDGYPVMSSGNHGVVFQMEDERNGKLYALKCFIKQCQNTDEDYKAIERQLEHSSSHYIIPFHFLDKELYVDTKQTEEKEFPVVLMDWIDGQSLCHYLQEIKDCPHLLSNLSYQFYLMASWLLNQPFFHGDLRPENIIITKHSNIVLIDYDNVCLKAHYNKNAKSEFGYNQDVDNVPLLKMALSLKLFSLNTELIQEFCIKGGSFFDNLDLSGNRLNNTISLVSNISSYNLDYEISTLIGAYHFKQIHASLFDFLVSKWSLKETEEGNELIKQGYILLQKSSDGIETAMDYFQKALEQNNIHVYNALGDWWQHFSHYSNMRRLLPNNIERQEIAVWYYIEGAELGDAAAQFNLGMCFYAGFGVIRDFKSAKWWLEKSANQGYACSETALGNLYYEGFGVPQDYEKAVYWYKRAAFKNETRAQLYLGDCYFYGRGVPRSYDNAVKWYTIVAEGENYNMNTGIDFKDEAIDRLASCFENGLGVPRNYEKAQEWRSRLSILYK